MFSKVFRKSCRLWDNVEKCGGAIRATDDVRIWRIRAVCLTSKATWTHAHDYAPGHMHVRALTHIHTHTHTQKYVIQLFHDNTDHANAALSVALTAFSLYQQWADSKSVCVSARPVYRMKCNRTVWTGSANRISTWSASWHSRRFIWATCEDDLLTRWLSDLARRSALFRFTLIA